VVDFAEDVVVLGEAEASRGVATVAAIEEAVVGATPLTRSKAVRHLARYVARTTMRDTLEVMYMHMACLTGCYLKASGDE
jgi:hypothetical protein